MIVRELIEALEAFPETATVEVDDDQPWPAFSAATDLVKLYGAGACGRCSEKPEFHLCPSGDTYQPEGK